MPAKSKPKPSHSSSKPLAPPTLERSKVSTQDQWDVASLYPTLKAWEKEYLKLTGPKALPLWKEVTRYQGRLGESPKLLKEALDECFALSRKLMTLYTYAHLRHDEEITDDANKAAYTKIVSTLHDFEEKTSWFTPELLSIDDKTISKFLSSPLLAEYKFHIEKIIRVKKHMLKKEGEELLAMASQALESSHKAFRAINDADFKFDSVKDCKGNLKELTHGSYSLYLRDKDRNLRENAFKTLQGTYLKYQNTLCELLNGEVQSHIFNAKARNYTSSLEAALFPKNIDVSVYHSLITAVNDNLKVLHKYIALRSKVMKIPSLHLYDMYVPLACGVDIRLTYKEAEDIVVESVAPLGSSYQNLLKKGLKDDGWVDRYENKNKRSGAYSSGCYDSHPYILMNYKGILRDVFTLAHEAGHSMHSLMSRKHQPYQYGDYPIFLAEVASTFNEELLMKLMLERAKTKEERIFLINEKIEDIRGTLFRQTMFAEFELWLHETAEKNIPLTPKQLNDAYRELNRRYFGASVALDTEAELEWARIPHFYYNFYVFQYATGISAALALAESVTKGGKKEREAYLTFLKSGCSRYPIDILASAGVDMRSPKPVASAISRFNSLVHLLEKELT